MKKWEIAVKEFLKKWKDRKEVIGAIACGSYINWKSGQTFGY